MMISYRHVVTYGATDSRWLSNVADLAMAQVGGNWLLFAVNATGGITNYRITDPDAPLARVQARAFPANLSYHARPSLTVLDMPAGNRLLVEGVSGAGVAGLSVGATGGLGGIAQLFPAERLGARLSASGEMVTDAGRFLFSARQDSLTLEINRINGDGSLIAVSSVTLPKPAGVAEASLDKIIAMTVDGQRLLVAISGLGNFVSTQAIGADGKLGKGMMHVAGEGTGYYVPSDIAGVQFGGHSFVVVAGATSSSLSVFRLDRSGTLTTTDHVVDELTTRFQSVTALAAAVVDGRGFVIAGGVDGGISIFTLLPDGRLLHLQNIVDTGAMTLARISAIEAQVIGGRIVLFVTSAGEAGVTQLVVDPGAVGTTGMAGKGAVVGTARDDLLVATAATTALQGGAGGDILVSGKGSITLTGGAGADIFAIVRYDGRAVIADYEPGVDRLDLSMLGMIRSTWQLNFAPQSWGMRISYGNSILEIRTRSGKSLLPTDFGNAMFPIGHYWLPELDPVKVETPPVTVGQWIFGSDAADRLLGGGGPDSIEGRAGNDTISAGSGDDAVDGGDGNDTIRGGDGADRIRGGNGNDTLWGDSGSDAIEGQGGHDLLYGGTGNDTLRGGASNDRLYGGDGADRLYGDTGNDTLSGENDNDYLEDLSGDNVLIGGAGNDTLVAGIGNDTLSGGSGDDMLQGGSGDDLLEGHSGNDTLNGRAGNDRLEDLLGYNVLSGEQGDDTLVSGTGRDVLRGGSGRDSLRSGDGNDRLYGDSDDDRLYADAGEDYLHGGSGNDRLYGGAGKDTVYGSTGNDTSRGEDGDDLLHDPYGDNLLYGDAGNDILRGGSGLDWLLGGSGDDRLYGGFGKDKLYGDAGNDRLYGEGHDDFLYDILGNNYLSGGSGNDRLISGAGRDTLDGGSGNDTLMGEGGRDYLRDLSGNNLMRGGSDNDTLTAGLGSDRLWGDAGNDIIYAGAGRDLAYGGSGNDWMYGQSGNDTLWGDAGNDTLRGGAGADVLAGGFGADVFLFMSVTESRGSEIDVIRDFAAGQDHLDLRALKLRFIDDDPFNAARQLRWQHVGSETRVTADLNGDRKADFMVRLLGRIALDADDFLL
ncbi:M10 family metallopeptidase C-terminal domain-containing protein [Paracoccus sp. SSK6]|uniref:M10 family metallopeptidase C-terminal domain-containing protein n=1 Tax=Paracoccus sp. SSK6 TaxID=3143131 RepID=UPI003219BAC5